jgi:hypothetical protein
MRLRRELAQAAQTVQQARIIMGGLFIAAVCFISTSSVDVMVKAAQGAYLDIISSSVH